VDIEGVDATLMSDTLLSIGLAESATVRAKVWLRKCVTVRAKVWLRKKTMDLCACESEEHEHGVGAGANTTLMSDTL
jgi:hypothetical protein